MLAAEKGIAPIPFSPDAPGAATRCPSRPSREWIPAQTAMAFDRTSPSREIVARLCRGAPPTHDTYDEALAANLTLSIKVIDEGLPVLEKSTYDLTTIRLAKLMIEDGYGIIGRDPRINFLGTLPWHGSIPEVEERIATVERRRAEAQSALDDALLSDEERAARDAQADIRRAEANAAPTRKVRGDGSQYLKHVDGKIEEVTS